jgi:hypothetical protein
VLIVELSGKTEATTIYNGCVITVVADDIVAAAYHR